MKLELRAITNSQRKRDNPVMMSSTIPSAKYSCSGSPLRLANGRTAIEGLLGIKRESRALVSAGSSKGTRLAAALVALTGEADAVGKPEGRSEVETVTSNR